MIQEIVCANVQHLSIHVPVQQLESIVILQIIFAHVRHHFQPVPRPNQYVLVSNVVCYIFNHIHHSGYQFAVKLHLMNIYNILTYFVLLVCPSGYQEHGGKCYFFSSEQKSWGDARTACQNIHTAYDLVNIENTNLNIFLTTNGGNLNYWTGLSDVSIEGTYVWTNGEGLIYGSTLMSDPWQSSQPEVYFYFIYHISCL